ncbi:MAG: N-acetylglucosamine kinase, partial [Dysgonamonadaceae bacterium]|nr:N-acetylglucosamine kinase [Dysgonamonadaceae bacterium]
MKVGMMLLIADSGSTKTTWCLVDETGQKKIFETVGYNPRYRGKDKPAEIPKPDLPDGFDRKKVRKVAFYGAGVCDDNHGFIEEAILSVFPNARVDVTTDLTGSARALLCKGSGFAAILGTGSNS